MAGQTNELNPGSPSQLGEVFGEGTAPPPSNYLHDEFLQMMRDHGIEQIAKESGLVQNGEIPQLKEYVASTPTKGNYCLNSSFLFGHLSISAI